jgi:HSP20 family protein
MYRRMRVPNVWREMDQLQQEMNRLMESSLWPRTIRSHSFPAINLWTSEDAQVITAEIPGIDPDQIDIEVSADTLTISGERLSGPHEEGMHYHRQERRFGKFNRTIQLPFMVDPNQVKASLKNGILEIHLVRAETDKPKKIVAKIA